MPSPEKPRTFQHKFAFLVGINEPHDGRQLQYCGNDVDTLRRILEQDGYDVIAVHDGACNYDPRCDQDPNRLRPIGLRDAFTEFVKKIKDPSNSLIVFLFSGHGNRQTESFLLCKEDITNSQWGSRRDTDLSINFFRKKIEETQCSYLFLIDACQIRSRNDRTEKDFHQQLLDAEAPGQSGAILFAAGEGEITREYHSCKMGLFSYFVVAALEGQGVSTDRVTWSRLYKYVNDEMNINGYRPSSLNINDDFVIINNCRREALPVLNLASVSLNDIKTIIKSASSLLDIQMPGPPSDSPKTYLRHLEDLLSTHEPIPILIYRTLESFIKKNSDKANLLYEIVQTNSKGVG